VDAGAHADQVTEGAPAVPDDLDREILAAVAAQAPAMEELLARLVAAPTLLGNEEPGQAIMAEAFAALGLAPVDVPMDADALRAHPGSSPFSWDVSAKRNVVATWPAAGAGGRSLVLGGHVDVVSPGSDALWRLPPFAASREEDWIYGRGTGDMKAGLAAMVGAVGALRSLGLSPNAPLHLESVVEEECTGNGALACVLAGYTADGAVIAEPFGDSVMTAQVGVLWFDVRVTGFAAHVGDAGDGVNAIERSYVVIRALRALEAELNERPPAPYDAHEHPINLNVGAIHGGDWPSTVAGECVLRCRIALYPGEEVAPLRERIERAVAAAAEDDPFLREQLPQVLYDGFACKGYEIAAEAPLVEAARGALGRVTGSRPACVASTATTDARLTGLYGATPSVCVGPYAERLHASDERVWAPSIVESAQALGLLVRDWCGVS
jgi:acetylornithine deacetylase